MKGSFPQVQTHVDPMGNRPAGPLRGLLPITLLLGLVNLLLMNDLTTLLPVEAEILLKEAGGSLPIFFLDRMEEMGISQIFWLRFPSVLLFVAAGALLYFYGKRLFGKESMVLSLLVLLSSPIFISLGKFASGDAWLLLLSVAHALSLLYLIKKPAREHYLIYGISIALGWWIAPREFAAFGLVLGLFLRWLHPQGREMRRRPGILWLWPLMYFLFYYTFFKEAVPSSFLLSAHSVSLAFYGLLVLVLFLPWIGFLGAGVVELVKNSPKREEMSLILLSWLLAGLFSYSIALAPILAIIAGRQALRYFREAYPRRPLVRGLHIIGLVAAFFGALWLMMEGFRLLGGAGFRLAMIVTAVYWTLSFLAIFGLFLQKPHFSWSALAGSGILLTFLAWTLLNPVVEQWRGFPRLVINELEGKKELFVPKEIEAQWPALKWYAEKEGVDLIKMEKDGWKLSTEMPEDSTRLKRKFELSPYGNTSIFLYE